METARVDIRRLQLLNDRINQCIDALNQVRLSVHGLSHTTGAFAAPVGLGSLAQPPAYGLGYPWIGQVPSQAVAPGLAHTGYPATLPGVFAPGLQAAAPFPMAGAAPFFGLSHSSAEPYEAFGRPLWSEPVLAARIAQTFPYAFQVLSPVVTV